MATSETIAAPAPVTDSTEEVPAVEGGPHIPDAPAPRRRGSRRKMVIAAGTVIVLGAVLGSRWWPGRRRVRWLVPLGASEARSTPRCGPGAEQCVRNGQSVGNQLFDAAAGRQQ